MRTSRLAVFSTCFVGLALFVVACSDDGDDTTCEGDACNAGGQANVGGSTSKGGATTKGGGTSKGGSTGVGGGANGGAPAGGTSAAVGGAPAGGTSAAVGGAPNGGVAGNPGGATSNGGSTAAGGSAVGGTQAKGGSAGAPAGGVSNGGTTSIAGAPNGGTAGAPNGGTNAAGAGGATGSGGNGWAGATGNMNIAGTAGVMQLPNLATNLSWWGAQGTAGAGTTGAAGAGNFPRIFASSWQPGQEPTRAFDGDPGGQTMWVSYGDVTTSSGPTATDPEWIGVEFASATVLTMVSMTPRTNGEASRGFGPKLYAIETSNTGQDSDWVQQGPLVYATMNATMWTLLPTPVSAKLIRLRIVEGWDIGPYPPPPATATEALHVYDPARNTQVRTLTIR